MLANVSVVESFHTRYPDPAAKAFCAMKACEMETAETFGPPSTRAPSASMDSDAQQQLEFVLS